MSDAPIFYVCGDTARNPGRSGIQTVVRSLAAAFGARHAPVRLVAWQAGRQHLQPLAPAWSLGLGAEPLRDPATWWGHRLPLHRHPRHRRAPAGSWVLLPELLYRDERARRLVDYAHRHGWRCAAILHDAIPLQHPEFVPPGLPTVHAEYLRGLSRADLILPNSEATAQGWRDFLARENLPGPALRVCTLAGDLPGIPRVLVSPPTDPDQGRRMLCVATLEPRKNHRALFAAYELAAARLPSLELDLVGAPYVDAQDIATAADALVVRYPGRVRWHQRVEHQTLRQLYARCDFTVYPSVVEGFGLPVIESLWFGRPCICANFSVMAENAIGGGCLPVHVRDSSAFATAMLALAEDANLRHRLTIEATTRPLKTWGEYAGEILDALRSV